MSDTTTTIEEFRAAAQRMLDVAQAADLTGDSTRVWGLLGWLESGLDSLADGTPSPKHVARSMPSFMEAAGATCCEGGHED